MKITDEELLRDVQRVTGEVGESIKNYGCTLTQYDILGGFSKKLIIKRFGSWNNAVNAAGFDARPWKRSPHFEVLREVL